MQNRTFGERLENLVNECTVNDVVDLTELATRLRIKVNYTKTPAFECGRLYYKNKNVVLNTSIVLNRNFSDEMLKTTLALLISTYIINRNNDSRKMRVIEPFFLKEMWSHRTSPLVLLATCLAIPKSIAKAAQFVNFSSFEYAKKSGLTDNFILACYDPEHAANWLSFINNASAKIAMNKGFETLSLNLDKK